MTTVQLPGKTDQVALGVYGVDPGFFDAMGIKLIAGRNFREGQVDATTPTTPSPIDPAAERALVAARRERSSLTERRRSGWASPTPRDAVGKQLMTSMTLPEYGLVPVDGRRRGRRRAFPLGTRSAPADLLLRHRRRGSAMMRSASSGAEPKAVLGQVEAVWKRLVPDIPFRARFVDDIVASCTTPTRRARTLFGVFALLAVVIGCLGLFGLAAFTAERRTKEIGIRKVLGARTRDIVRLLVWQFSRPVLIANLIAWPIAWWLMRDWLNGFDARIDADAGAVRDCGLAGAGHRGRHDRRPRLAGGADQSGASLALRIARG